MRRICLSVLLLTFIVSPIVSGQRRKTPKTRAGTQAQQAKPKGKTSQTRDEGYEEALRVWDKYYAKCGGSYYLRLRNLICEYRSVSITNKESILTEADRLNGVERDIRSDFIAQAERCYDGGWSAWHGASWVSVGLIKKNGSWSEGPVPFGVIPIVAIAVTPKLSCSDVPGVGTRLQMNLDDYCRSRHGASSIAVNTAGDAYSWRCKVDDAAGKTRYFEMNMDEACRNQYGSEFKAAFDDIKDPASWHCVQK